MLKLISVFRLSNEEGKYHCVSSVFLNDSKAITLSTEMGDKSESHSCLKVPRITEAIPLNFN